MAPSDRSPRRGAAEWGEGLEFRLPEELIAQHPAERRESSRLMVVDRADGRIEHRTFAELPDLLGAESLLIGNDSRVFPARLIASKPTGGKVELLVLRLADDGPVPVMFRSAKTLRQGTKLRVGEYEATVSSEPAAGRCTVDFGEAGARAVVAAHGSVPLPPYIRRPDGVGDEDVRRYQTVYARDDGSVAAPTAGLHFTDDLLGELRSRGVDFRTVTLHVGPGTFAPIRGSLDEHTMEAERYSVSPETAASHRDARERGRRVVAVGTTSVRTLESACDDEGQVLAGTGEASLFIRPGFRFRAVDALVTNFHLPGSTLLALVMALGGEALIRRAYDEAVAERYRFYSYGDAMLIL